MSFKIVDTMTTEGVPDTATEHMVSTRDGVQLATDVYLPENATQHSAILVRTPYDKTSRYTALRYEAEYYVSRGFVVVAQDVRGKFNSTGKTIPYAFDVDDAYDTVDWIAKQPWSNGKVGVTGASYYGFTAWAAAASGHPAIKAAVPQVTSVDMGDMHVGSRWRQEVPAVMGMNDLLQIWTNNNGYLAEVDWTSDTPANVIADARSQIGTCISADEKLTRSESQRWYNPYGDRHPYYTTNIPILHWQNWYDPGLCPAGMTDWRHFRSLAALRNLHYLRVGSADHSGFQLEDVGKGEEAWAYTNEDALARRISTECAEVADFFDEHVNGIKPNTPRPRARWHVGHVGWQETEEFPPPSKPRSFYLAAVGGNVNELWDTPATEATKLSWQHDPSNPVPSTVDMEALWYVLASYPDERDLAERPDVLTFRTTPLATDVDFAGQPVLRLHVETSSPSTYLFARVQDVHPDGTTRPISLGRAVLTEETSGDIVLFMDDNAYRLLAGHKLQVQIASSDSPHWGVHPGTTANPWTTTDRQVTTQTLTTGGVVAARLELPVIEANS